MAATNTCLARITPKAAGGAGRGWRDEARVSDAAAEVLHGAVCRSMSGRSDGGSTPRLTDNARGPSMAR